MDYDKAYKHAKALNDYEVTVWVPEHFVESFDEFMNGADHEDHELGPWSEEYNCQIDEITWRLPYLRMRDFCGFCVAHGVKFDAMPLPTNTKDEP